MGMAASQARLLTLQARQSDLEYQGQQINQERSVLSQQVTALYNSLLTMTVPTPPSTNDYTTVQYAGTIGATSYTFDASSVKPCTYKAGEGTQTYYVTVEQSAYGDSLDKNPNISTVDGNPNGYVWVFKESSFKQNPDGTNTTEKRVFSENEIASLYVVTSETTGEDGKEDKISYKKASILEHFTQVDGGFVANTGVQLMRLTNGYGKKYQSEAAATVSVDGYTIYDNKAFKDVYSISEDLMNSYTAAVANSGLTKPNGDPYDISEFYMYFNDKGEACFVLRNDADDSNDNAITYKYIANGDYVKRTTYDNCKLQFDPTSGRITSVSIPNYKTITKEDGTTEDVIASYTTMEVAATTISDDAAYEDAYNQYEYAKYMYDKKQQEVNAQTEIIQQMDRNLQLKLQRLDNEREQITNEIEALDKVISENIQGSYKTFSG